MSLKKKITYTVFSNWIVLVLNIVISFFLAPFIVHKLGNMYYGIWAIVMQFTGYLYLMDLGVRDSVIRYTSRLNAKNAGRQLNQIISTAIVVYSLIAAISMLIVLTGAWFFPIIFDISPGLFIEVRIVVLLTGLSIAQMFIFNVFSGILIGLQRYYLFNVFHLLLVFIRAGLILYFLGRGHGIVALSSIQLLQGLVSGVILVVLAKKALSKSGLPFTFNIYSSKRFYVHFKR